MENNVRTKIKNLSDFYNQYNIDAYLVPSTDEYLSEYSPDYYKRLEYITGFSGSNGYAILTKHKIYFFTDGRYITQAYNQLQSDISEIYNILDLDKLDIEIGKVGYDPKLVCQIQLDMFKKLELLEIQENLIDKIWADGRPEKSKNKVFNYDIQFSGQNSSEKILNIQNKIKELSADYHLITDCTSICWLLNIRASDVPFCPLLLAKLIVSQDKVYLFTDLSKLDNLDIGEVILYEEEKIYDFIRGLSGSIILDKNKTPISYIRSASHLIKIHNQDLCALPKACKNYIEIEGAKNAHMKDAVALIEFFTWLDESIKLKTLITEYNISKQLTYFRSKQDGYISDSFSSICGFQDNGAIIHYRPDQLTSKNIEGEGLLLIDSGGHYNGGTTDVTRTINVGNPDKEHIKFYTKVLKGHIALLKAKFPQGTCCNNLDVLARQYLWQEGLDYPHGTGHGVGNALSVHEGPQAFNMTNNQKLKKNMILSNEPGYYISGKFGIRIENLIYVKESEYKGFFQFENLTMVPYCSTLIDVDMLDNEDKEYIKDFYKKIILLIKPLLSEKAKNYLEREINSLLIRL